MNSMLGMLPTAFTLSKPKKVLIPPKRGFSEPKSYKIEEGGAILIILVEGYCVLINT